MANLVRVSIPVGDDHHTFLHVIRQDGLAPIQDPRSARNTASPVEYICDVDDDFFQRHPEFKRFVVA